MRMWMVPPALMCNKHLLGEHVEIHMLEGCIKQGHSLTGYIEKGLIDLSKIDSRHRELVAEMKRRDFSHHSPLMHLVWEGETGSVNVEESHAELLNRCHWCRQQLLKGAAA